MNSFKNKNSANMSLAVQLCVFNVSLLVCVCVCLPNALQILTIKLSQHQVRV
jgi:hypothetical protein